MGKHFTLLQRDHAAAECSPLSRMQSLNSAVSTCTTL